MAGIGYVEILTIMQHIFDNLYRGPRDMHVAA